MLLFFANYCFSQKEKSTQLGQTTLEELQMSVYKKDSSASAIVLMDQGNFYISNPKKRYYTTDYYSRIKIFTNTGLDEGNVEIIHLADEILSNINAITYNLDSDSTIEETPISKDNILVSNINDTYKKTILTLPNVKKGSIIEYRYSMTSRNIEIPDWYFQQHIPVIQSQFITMVPNYINHLVTLVGSKKLTKNEEKIDAACFKDNKSTSKCRYSLYQMDSISRFVPEKLMPNPQSYNSHLRFLLKNKSLFGSSSNLTWERFDKRMENMVNRNNDFQMHQMITKMIPDSLISSGKKLEKALKIYKHIKNEFDLKNQVNKGTVMGSGEKQQFDKLSQTMVAIYLYYTLDYINIPSYFVYTSTQDLGITNKEYPSSRNFNYLLIKTKINGKSYFLDPSNVNLSFGMVDPEILNRDARVLDFKNGSYWQKITSVNGLYKSSNVDFKISDSKNSQGVLKITRRGYSGLNFREEFKTIGKEKRLENMEAIIPDLEVGLHVVKNQFNYSKDHIEEFNFKINSDFFENINSQESEISFNPILFDQLESSLFTKKERKYPVQFMAPITNIYRSSITIPKNYTYTNPRESIKIQSPDNTLSYVYLIKSDQDKIDIYIKFKVNKTYFTVEEYQKLKEFYQKVVAAEKYNIQFDITPK